MKYLRSIFASLIILSSLHFSKTNTLVINCGITETFEEIEKLFEGIAAFFSHIHSISEMIGFTTIILFVFILFFSSGLSAIGIPKGKKSFILSLLLTDGLWILWEYSFNPDSLDFLIPMAKANGILFIPLLSLYILHKTVPSLFSRIKTLYRNIFLKKNKVSKIELLSILDKYKKDSHAFEKSLIDDVISQSNLDTISISHETKECIERITETITTLHDRPND